MFVKTYIRCISIASEELSIDLDTYLDFYHIHIKNVTKNSGLKF